MLELLAGTGLAAAAGLNAWMPLFVLGLADRLLPAVELPAAWSWLSSDLALWICGILLVIEVVADKIPAVDSVNDVVQTLFRPAAGGVVFGAGSGAQALSLDDSTSFFAGGGWVPVAIGVGVALGVHALKALARPAANAVTGGLAAPVVSTVEDVSAFLLAIAAIVLPVLAGLLLVGVVVALLLGIRRVRRGRHPRAGAPPTMEAPASSATDRPS